MRDQTHKESKCIAVFADLGKYPAPGQEKIKGSRREFYQEGKTIKCPYATLDTLIHSITTAITLTGKMDFLPHQNPESKCSSTSLQVQRMQVIQCPHSLGNCKDILHWSESRSLGQTLLIPKQVFSYVSSTLQGVYFKQHPRGMDIQ